MLAEQTQHAECSFVTLTYDDEHLPTVRDPETDEWIPTLVKSHLQKSLALVRRKITAWDMSMRHFACGEYGEKTGRPHYHLIAFGLGVGAEEHWKKWWNKGFSSVYEANAKTMSYVAKYCLKGSRDPEPISHDPLSQSDQRVTVQPFRLMSNRPPIGAGLTRNIARSLKTRVLEHDLVLPNGMERQLKMPGGTYPLDRTMREHVKKHLNLTPEHAEALFRRHYPEPTDEQRIKAAHEHTKARRTRHLKTKL